MEWLTVLIGVAVFFLSALIIYCISAFSMREKTFEEVMEEQKRREEEDREKVKAEKKAEREHQKKKYKKGKHEKVKDKLPKIPEPELKAESKLVNLEIEPEIIEPTETLGLNTGLKQRGKKEKGAKPIQQNKDHTTVLEKSIEPHLKTVTPKDEMEIKKNVAEKSTKNKTSHPEETKKMQERVVAEKIEKVKTMYIEESKKSNEKSGFEKVEKGKMIHAEEHKKNQEKSIAENTEKVKTVHTEEHKKVTTEKVKTIHSEEHKKSVTEKIEKVKHVHSESQPEKDTKVKHSVEMKENLPPKKAEKEESQKSKHFVDDVDKTAEKIKAPMDDVLLNGPRLISAVKNTKLSDSEVQSLVDILLNKQGITANVAASESWNKKSQKGDPVVLLKKQLEEKEKALHEEQTRTTTANALAKELKNLLLTEKNNHKALEKTLQDKLEKQQNEMDALQQRMQHTHDQHLLETRNLQGKIKTLEQASDKEVVHKLTEENKILKDSLNLKVSENVRLEDKLKHSEKDLSSLKNSIQAGENARKALESKISTYEERIKNLEGSQKEVDSLTHKQIEEVSHELRKAEAKNASLSNDLQKATNGLTAAEVEVKTLKARLQELENHLSKADISKEAEVRLHESERKCSELEGNVKNLEKQLADLSNKLDVCDTEIIRLQQENRSLHDENKTIAERLQAAPATNGSVHENGPSMPLVEHEKIVSSQDKKMSELASGLEAEKEALQRQLSSKIAELSDLHEQLSQQKKKNDDLRGKNWKAMEALKQSEDKVTKTLQSVKESSSAGITEIEVFDKAVFQRLFPDVQVSEKLPHKDWVVAFEKHALKKVSDKTGSADLLAQENEKLKKEIEGFKNTMNTATAKNDRLKELEEQNNELHKQLADSEKKLVELRSLNEKLKQVEVENYQLKSSLTTTSGDTERYSQLENENSRLQTEVVKFQNIVSETENKLHQLEKSIDQEEKKWHDKLKQARSQAEKDSGSSQKDKELESLVAQQELQIQEYRRILSLTDNRLRGLENKIEAEENAWRKKHDMVSADLAQTKKALSNIKQEFQISKGSQEMQTKEADLEDELRDAREKIIEIVKEKETELIEIRTHLEIERKKNRDLSLNVVKLNGIIKTGQDALSQEQQLVKKLQESLDSKSVNSGATDLEEIDQLRVKLSEKQKLLEREISVNKQLSERLAQLGMLAASTSDSGTSV